MNRIKTTEDIVYNDNVSEDIVIAHISDIHFNYDTSVKKLNKLVNAIKKVEPTYIMITGDTLDIPDITDNKEKIKDLIEFLINLSEISKVFISIGNHDILSELDLKFFKKIGELGNIYVLDNESYLDKKIFISGFTIPNNYYYNVAKREPVKLLSYYLDRDKKLLYDLPNNVPKIALIHSPINLVDDKIINKLKEYDLILSGHTHGGMVPDFLTFLFPDNMGIISPNKKWFPEIAKGKIVKNVNGKDITIIINGAITKLSVISGKIFHKLNFVYNSSLNKIIIRKKRRY